MREDLRKIKGINKLDVLKLKLIWDNGIHKMYMKEIDENKAMYYQIDNDGNIAYKFLGQPYKGLELKLRERLCLGQDQDIDDEISKELISLLNSKDIEEFNRLLPLYMGSLNEKGCEKFTTEVIKLIELLAALKEEN